LRIGLDLDNTIAIYDHVFRKYAREFIRVDGYESKIDIRTKLCECGLEDEWTYLQGEVYGKYMDEAKVACNFLNTLVNLQQKGYYFEIISHRTKRPSSGALHDMHKSAERWVEEHINSVDDVKDRLEVKFFETVDEKVKFIAAENLSIFVDDLEKILTSPIFPNNTLRVNYNPQGNPFTNSHRIKCIRDWTELVPICENLNEKT
jgi:arsenate reductase-like glutaredoxin family protein